jgi:(2Fe-2S) ferredoxin
MEEQSIPYQVLILVCTNVKAEGKVCCGHQGAGLRDALKAAVEERGLKGRVRVSQTGCLDQCALGPNIMVFPPGIWYSGVQEEDLPELISRHFEAKL